MQKLRLSLSDEQVTRWSLVFGMTIWFLDLNVLYAVTSLACRWDLFAFSIAGLSGFHFVQFLITLVTLALMLVLIYLPWRNWQRFTRDNTAKNAQLLQATARDRRALLAFVAMLLNLLLFLFAIAFFVPLFALNACAQV